MTAATQPVHPIRRADRQAIQAHLHMLFRRADAVVPGSMIDIVWSDAELSKLNEYERFPATPAGLDMAAAKAAQMNELGRNVYVGANPRKPGTRGDSRNEDVAFALHHWVDADTEAAMEKVLFWQGQTPSAVVTTGTEPFERSHLYWELDAPCFDLQAWTARQKALAAALCGDPSPVDPRRVMRLPGAFSYPKPSKMARGYRTELVTSDQSGTVTTPDLLTKGLYVPPAPSAPEDGAKPIGDVALLARDQEDLIRTLQATPNDLDYQDYVTFVHAFKAACGGSADGFEAFVEWATQWPGNTVEAAEEKWHSISESRIGADYIYQAAARAGVAVSLAEQDFDALEPDPEPYVAPAPKPAQRSAPLPRRLAIDFSPAKLERRKWVLGYRFMEGVVTGGIGAPGVSKSTFTLLSGISIAANRELTGEAIHRPGRVWIHNHEDDEAEMERRIAGVCLHYRIDFDEIRDNFMYSSGAVTRLIVAAKENDVVKQTNAVQEIKDTINEYGIVFLGVDPFVSTHDGVNENSNTEVERVIDAFRRISRETGCAIDLVHHSVKNHDGDSESRAGDMNAARGAGALIGAVRITYTLAPMSAKGAQERGIPLDVAARLIRLDHAKGNYSPRSLKPVWYKLNSVSIGNGAEGLDNLLDGGPESDTVAVHELFDLDARIAEEAASEEEKQDLLAEGYRADIVAEFPNGRSQVPQGDMAERMMKRWGVQRSKAQDRIKETVPDEGLAAEVKHGGRTYLVYRTSAGDHAKAGKWVHVRLAP
jgi:hypothetical protein